MDEYSANKKYAAFRIPDRKPEQANGSTLPAPNSDPQRKLSRSDGMFYEIEYDCGPIPGVGKFVLKPQAQRIAEPEKDEIRELFGRMREIARTHRSIYDFSRFFDRRVQNDNAIIFRQQGLFMKDFTDDYDKSTQLSQYYPNYQMMGYEQLRTYFTWRTRVRDGHIANTSLSYAFLYIYELLGNIGVTDPQDGLDKLMLFWKAFREYNKFIDKYMLRWLKDYHVYYELRHSFREFVETNNLTEHYPTLLEPVDGFALFCSISKYNIKKSAFYTEETSKMISDCFAFVMDRIRQEFESKGIVFDDALFRPTKKVVAWHPFKDALFHHWVKQPNRQVILSESEIYMCKKNEWTFSTVITTEKGKQFIGYVMKQMESVLRQITKYRFKLSANIEMMDENTARILMESGLFIDEIVSAAVLAFHRETTKTVITVDQASLARIRQEALLTQQSLIVEEQPQQTGIIPPPPPFAAQSQSIFADAAEDIVTPIADVWTSLKDALTETELQALVAIVCGGDIKAFADACGIMVEVLADGINDKAMDYIGDSLMDEAFVLYDDYKEHVKELVK